MTDASREPRLEAQPPAFARNDRWAVIVGISTYQDGNLNLKYADRDAAALYERILSPSGGRFERDKVCYLVNEEATAAAVRKALYSFLKKPTDDHMVLLYFACHGAPDPDRPENVYLLPYDTDPRDISGTAVRMSDIELALHTTLRAKKIVVVADTCHSGAIGAGRRGSDAAAVTNTFLQRMSKAKDGVALLTSAQAGETAKEDDDLEHGIFTHHLLAGMGGAADGYGGARKDGVVGVQELFDYVRDRVTEATDGSQHPLIGPTSFDPDLPMAVSGRQNAQLHYKLGTRLVELARTTGANDRLESAASHLDLAIDFAAKAGTPFPEASVALGEALLANDNTSYAIEVLECLGRSEVAPPSTLLYLAMAHAKNSDNSTARESLESFAAAHPGHEWAPFAIDMAGTLRDVPDGECRALLIGINVYQASLWATLSGCVNDVGLWLELFREKPLVPPDNITVLLDEGATRPVIIAAFQQLAEDSNQGDTVIVHFSGHADADSPNRETPPLVVSQGSAETDAVEVSPRDDSYLVTHDTQFDQDVLIDAIGARELHELMNAIPARSKVLILDTHPHTKFIEFAERDGDYAMILASRPGESSAEHAFTLAGENAMAGILTGTLTQVLRDSEPLTITYRALMDGCIALIRDLEDDASNQLPMFIGDHDQPIFGEDRLHTILWDLGARRMISPLTKEHLLRLARARMRWVKATCPPVDYLLGRALMKAGEVHEASHVLARACEVEAPRSRATFALDGARLLAGTIEARRPFEYLETDEELSGPERIELSRLMMAIGEPERALETLEFDPDMRNPQFRYYRALANAQIGDFDAAAAALAELSGAERAALSDEDRGQAEWICGVRPIAKRALLIAIGDYPGATLAAPVLEAKSLKATLVAHHGFRDDHVTVLADKYATRAAVVAAMRELSNTILPGDVAVVSFSGHVARDSEAQSGNDLFILHDTIYDTLHRRALDRHIRGSITSNEFHDLITAIDTPAKTVILDPGSTGFLEMVERARSCQLIMSAGPGETVYDGRFMATLIDELNIETPATFGGLAEAMAEPLGPDSPLAFGVRQRQTELGRSTLTKAWLRPLRNQAFSEQTQTPTFVGDRDTGLLTCAPGTWGEPLSGARFAQAIARYGIKWDRGILVESVLSALELRPVAEAVHILEEVIREQRVRGEIDRDDQVSLGLGYATLGRHDEAIRVLEEPASDPSFRSQPTAQFHLGRVLFETKTDLTRAVSELSKVTERLPDDARAQYYLGLAIHAMVERETLRKADAALSAYLDQGAPLGHEKEVWDLLARSDRTR